MWQFSLTEVTHGHGMSWLGGGPISAHAVCTGQCESNALFYVVSKLISFIRREAEVQVLLNKALGKVLRWQCVP